MKNAVTLALVVIACSALGAPAASAQYYFVDDTEIGVTNQRLIYKRGLVARATKEVELRCIEVVDLEQSLLGRLLDYGRVGVHGTGVADIVLPSMADPLGLRRALQDGIAALQRGTT